MFASARVSMWSCIAAAMMLATVSIALAAEDLRTWTDKSGKFKVKARLTNVEDGRVVLEKADGTELEIPLVKLSQADQDYVAQVQAGGDENPFEPSPFQARKKSGAAKKGKSKAAKRTSAADEDIDTAAATEPQEIDVNWSAADEIALAAPEGGWSVSISEAASTMPGPLKSAPLPRKTSFFEGLKGLAVNPYCGRAAAGFVLGEPRPSGTTRVVLCDLKTGKTTPPAVAPVQMVPVAVHDDGKQIVMRRDEFGFGNQDRLEVWTLRKGVPDRAVSWVPYGDVQGAGRDVMWAEFIDADHLATSSRGGRVAIWTFPDLAPECSFATADGAVPALSPDRKYIAYCTGNEVGLVDVESREVVAQQSTPENLQWPYLAFSPSGKRLACVAFDKVLVWSVADGKLERVIPCAGVVVHGAIAYPDENYVLANNQYLIDVENQLKLWTYMGHEQVRTVGGWTFLGVTDGEQQPGALVAARIPHPGALDLLNKALTDPDLFVLKAGTVVRIDLSQIPDATARAAIESALSQRLAAIGCTVGAAGTIDLVASMEGPKQRDVSFIASGDYKMQEYIGRVRFVYAGQPVWETSGTNVPFVVTLQPGENIEGYLRAREKPDYAYFETVELPKFLQKPSAGQPAGGSLTLGQSQVTTRGVK